jgi:hypothetical protein
MGQSDTTFRHHLDQVTEASLNVMYHLTHRMMISWSKCRPLNRSCAEVGSVIPAVIAGYRAFQQFAPEPDDQPSGQQTIRQEAADAVVATRGPSFAADQDEGPQ